MRANNRIKIITIMICCIILCGSGLVGCGSDSKDISNTFDELNDNLNMIGEASSVEIKDLYGDQYLVFRNNMIKLETPITKNDFEVCMIGSREDPHRGVMIHLIDNDSYYVSYYSGNVCIYTGIIKLTDEQKSKIDNSDYVWYLKKNGEWVTKKIVDNSVETTTVGSNSEVN